MSSRARLKITVHIGLTIRVSAIFVFACRVKTSIILHCWCLQFYLSVFWSIDISVAFMDNFGYCPYATFLRRETRKGVWVLYFDHIRFRITTVFRNSYVSQMHIPAFSRQNKVTKMCPKYLLTRYCKWPSHENSSSKVITHWQYFT